MVSIQHTMPRVGTVLVMSILGFLLPGIPCFIMIGTGIDAGLLALALASAGAWLYLIVRGASIGFSADDSGLTVANFLRTHRLAWSEVANVSVALGPFLWQAKPGNFTLYITRTDGRRIPVIATLTRLPDLAELHTEIEPVTGLATANNVSTVSKPLDAGELVRNSNALTAINAVARIARHL